MEENNKIAKDTILYGRQPIIPAPKHPFIFGRSGPSSKYRAYSEDDFDPKLVPSYVKEIKVEIDSEGKKHFCYVDDYGQSQRNN